MTVPVEADGAFGLYGAVGDACACRRLGFGNRRAAVAARFARHRGGDDAAVAASWIAGALADTGLIDLVVPPDATPRTRMLLLADAPHRAACLVAALPGLPAHAADVVRWHQEHDDGTGIPDRLRWDGIPPDAAALGIVHAFLAAVEDPDEPRDPAEAAFALSAESGRAFNVELVRAFRAFVAGAPTDWDAPLAVTLPAVDDDDALAGLAARIDGRDAATRGSSERTAALAAALAARLSLDGARAGRLGRLIALGRVQAHRNDGYDPLSRFAREHRAAVAGRAAAIAAAVPRYAADAPELVASAAWFEDGGAGPLASVLALALAAGDLDPFDAPRLLGAAAGTQFDPAVVAAYLTAQGAPT